MKRHVTLASAVCLALAGFALAGDAPTQKATKPSKAGTTKPASAQKALNKRIASLVSKLGAEDYDTREGALQALIKIGTPAVPALKAATKSKDPEVAALAADALAGIAPAPKTKPKPAQSQRRPAGLPNPGRLGPDAMKQLQRQLPKALEELLKNGQSNGRMRVWTWTNAPRASTRRGPEARLGLGVGPTSAVLRAQFDIPRGEGLVVNELDVKGHAATHGVKLYDVILAIGERPVRTRHDLARLLERGGTLRLLRKAKLHTVKLPAPAAKAAPGKTAPGQSKPQPKPVPKTDERDF